MKKIIFTGFVIMLALNANADFNLNAKVKAIICYGDDNQSWIINAKRNSVKYTVEGESKGPKKIIKRDSDGGTFISYKTAEGILTLSDQGDTFQFIGEEPQGISCQ